MRTRTGLVLGLLLALSAAGCAGDGDDGAKVATAGTGARASTSAAAGKLSDAEAAAKFGQCMRDNGVPNFEDPQTEGGGWRMHVKDGTDKDTVDAATEKCKQFMPNGGEPPKLDPQQQEQQRKFAQCMRDNGLPNFPDPEPDGGLKLNLNELGVDGPDDPKLKAAQNACQEYQLKPPGGAATTRSGG